MVNDGMMRRGGDVAYIYPPAPGGDLIWRTGPMQSPCSTSASLSVQKRVNGEKVNTFDRD